VAIQNGEGVFEPDAKLADDRIRIRELLLVFLLGKVLVAEAPPVIADVGRLVPVEADVYRIRAGEDLLVERIGDDLSNAVTRVPRLQQVLLHVEVERLPVLIGNWGCSHDRGLGL
jgi:hypothetical protein